MKMERIAGLAILTLVILFLAKTITTSACPFCWTHPWEISSGTAGKSRVLALFDQSKTYLHVFWYDAADTAIYHYAYRPDSGGYYCPVERVAHTTIGTFGAAVDSAGHLHFVWAAPSEIGPYGETSNRTGRLI